MGRAWSAVVAYGAAVSFGLVACGGAEPDPATPSSTAPAPAAPTPAAAPVGGTSGVGQTCGTRGAAACQAGLFCDYVAGEECGASDKPGHCAEKAQACTADVDPVCGCDGKAYSNACVANAAGMGVKKKGPCT